MLKKVHLDYDFNTFINANYNEFTSSVTHKEGHEDSTFDFYGEHNTKISQKFWDNDTIDFKSIGEQLNIDVVSISSILQPPGNIIPIHNDTFFKINQKYPHDERTKVRANIFLQDWETGHLLQYEHNKVWETCTYWKKGEGFMWDSSVLHVGANIGLTNKLTLQVSGFYGHI